VVNGVVVGHDTDELCVKWRSCAGRPRACVDPRLGRRCRCRHGDGLATSAPGHRIAATATMFATEACDSRDAAASPPAPTVKSTMTAIATCANRQRPTPPMMPHRAISCQTQRRRERSGLSSVRTGLGGLESLERGMVTRRPCDCLCRHGVRGEGEQLRRDRRERSWEAAIPRGFSSALDEPVACCEGRVSARGMGAAWHEERPVGCVFQRQALRSLGGRAGARGSPPPPPPTFRGEVVLLAAPEGPP
jgi:hypothetical protein